MRSLHRPPRVGPRQARRVETGLDEMLGVVVYMGGGPALMYAANAIAAFDEFADKAPT